MRMKKWRNTIFVLTLLGAIAVAVLLGMRLYTVQLAPELFQESSRPLSNPDRGFYRMQGFQLREEPQDWQEKVDALLHSSADQTLLLIQIDLHVFRTSPLSAAALENVDALLGSLTGHGKRLILRFLYDWYGNADFWEPNTLEQIAGHMQQLQPILQKYDKDIFLMQGLFTGNWGEMNGTAYSSPEQMRQLASQLQEAAGAHCFFAVRTPAQWRTIAQKTDPFPFSQTRIGLFNDGMLGSALDYGTYAPDTDAVLPPEAPWPKAAELSFQEELCRYVPNGGEVILDNPCNDLEAAIRDLRTMHVTYLNWEYDRSVLEKWERTEVEEPGCFAGVNGLEYMEQHLGYRIHIDSAALRYNFLTNRLQLGVLLKNTGFAPIYSDKHLTLTLRGEQECLVLDIPQDIRSLVGGNDLQPHFFGVNIPASHLRETEYDVHFDIWDPITQQRIALANDQEPGENGCRIGHIRFSRAPWWDWIQQKCDFHPGDESL